MLTFNGIHQQNNFIIFSSFDSIFNLLQVIQRRN